MIESKLERIDAGVAHFSGGETLALPGWLDASLVPDTPEGPAYRLRVGWEGWRRGAMVPVGVNVARVLQSIQWLRVSLARKVENT